MTDQAQPGPEDFGLEAPAPSWPKVVGIISIVWGSIGILCTVLGVGATLVFRPMAEQAAEGGPLPPTMDIGPLQIGQFALGFVVTVLLIVAGAATAGRKASGRGLHLFYGLMGLLSSLFGLFIGISQARAMTAWVAENPDSPFAKNHNETMAIAITLVMVAFFSLWPLFCVFWFGMLNKRPEVGAPEITA